MLPLRGAAPLVERRRRAGDRFGDEGVDLVAV
jgi:hypothetical protein